MQGSAIAQRFAKEHASLILVARSADQLQEVRYRTSCVPDRRLPSIAVSPFCMLCGSNPVNLKRDCVLSQIM